MGKIKGWDKKRNRGFSGMDYWEGQKVWHGSDYAISHTSVSKSPRHWKGFGVFVFNAKSRKQVINRTNLTKQKATEIAINYMKKHPRGY